MEQRALLASALVLGSVTAAGAGGYLAVRQLAAPAAAETSAQVASGPESPATDPAEGTVAEIEAPPSPATAKADVAPAESASSGRVAAPEATRPAPAATVAVERPVTRPRQLPAATPAPSRPPAPVRQEAPASAPAPRSTPSVARSTPTADSTPTSSTPRTEEPAGDSWPSRDVGTAPDDRWATRDAGNASTGSYGSGDGSLPSRTPVTEPTTPPAPARRLETVTIPADAVIGIQLEKGVSTATAKVEDAVRARVTRDLIAGGDVVIPAGARLLGNVTLVEEGGKVKERARLGIRFHTLVLANGTEVKLPTETIYRDGESPAGRSAAKIGGAAVGGAILGAIMGGGKGAVIGAATGAGSGTGWAMAGDRQPAELRAGQSLTVRVSDSVSTQIER